MARPKIRGAHFAVALSAVGALCLLSPPALMSQLAPERPFTLDRTAVRSFPSAATGVTYKLYISLPHSYEAEYQKHSGGGPKFLSFLVDELAPAIEQSYRAAPDDRSMVADLEAYSDQLRGRSYEGLELRTDILDDETHNSVFPRALSNGLRFVFGAR